jgi:hypothetical protein
MATTKPKKEEQPSPYKSDTAPKDPDVADLEQYLKDFRAAENYVHTNYHDTWFDCWKAFNGQRTKIGYNSIADAFVPETRTIVESLVANIAGSNPTFAYVPTNEEQSTDTKVLSELIAYYWDANHMGVKSQSWVRDAILYGTGVLHVTWDAEKNMPCIENVPLRDFFVDPAAVDLEHARFAGFRYLADKEELKKEEVINPDWKEGDPEDKRLIKKYKNLDQTQPVTSEGQLPTQLDKANKEQMLGVTPVNDDRKIEVILIYYMDEGEEKLVEIANQTVVIREVESPYQREEMEQDVEVTDPTGAPSTVKKKIEEIPPFLPFAILRNTIDSSLFYGTGDVEVIIDRQETLNDVENLDLDNLHYLNNVMWRIDPAYEDMASEIESTPGIVIPIPRFGLEAIEKPQITADLDSKKQEIKEEMRRATAADEIIQGSQPEGGRTTATEVQATTSQAMTRFQTKVTNLESEGYAQLGSVLFKMSQIFVDQGTVVRIVGQEGVAFKDFDPNEFSGYYEPHVKLDTTIKKIKEERGMKDNQFYQLLVNNPNVPNQEAVIRLIGKSLDATDEDINKLFEVPPQVAQQQQMQSEQDKAAQEVPQAVQQAQMDHMANQVQQGGQGGVDPEQESQQAIQQARADFMASQQQPQQ